MKAFTLTLLAALICFSQAAVAENAPKFRDPEVATGWATYIPGAGHIYAGEPGKGYAMLLSSAGIAVGGFMLQVKQIKKGESGMGAGLASGAAILGIYLYSVVDAGKAAQRTNAKNGLVIRISPDMRMDSGEMVYGVRFGFALPARFEL